MKKIIGTCFILLSLWQTRAHGQVGDAYANAAATARTAATKTKCPETKAYCLKVAAWCDCMAENGKTGAGKDCGNQPISPPPCEADMAGGAGGANSFSSTSSTLQNQQQQYQQTQVELESAKNASMAAYTNAINSGASGSSAMVDATLAGAGQISDGKAALIYTGVGLGVSLFMHISEKKAAEQQKQADDQAEQERKNLIISTKTQFVEEALDINKYSFADLVTKDRYAAVLLTPKNFSTVEDPIYFTYPIAVPKYSDGTYPLKPEIERSLLLALDKTVLTGNNVHILYPITDLEKFNNDFVKKMGSGKVIYLNAELLNFSKPAFEQDSAKDSQTDFWGNPVKSDKKAPVEKTGKKPAAAPAKKTTGDFWNQ
jgi:hypothetical protein